MGGHVHIVCTSLDGATAYGAFRLPGRMAANRHPRLFMH